MKFSFAVGVLLASSSTEHANALSIHPRIHTALSSTALKQPTAPVTDYNDKYIEDGFDVDYITSALLEPPSPVQLGQRPSLTNYNGWAAPEGDEAEFGHFVEPEHQSSDPRNPLPQQFVRRNDNESFRAPNRQTQQPPAPKQLARRNQFNKRQVTTGRERRTNWESYAIPGIPARNVASNTGGVIGSPGGIGNWRYSSSYGPATSTDSADARFPGTPSFPSSSNGVAWNQNGGAQSKNYGAVVTGAERRARLHSVHSFAPSAPKVGISSRVSAVDGGDFDGRASVNFAPRNHVHEKKQGGAVIGLGADRLKNFSNLKPSIPSRQTQRAGPSPGIGRNNQSNLVAGAGVDHTTKINGFDPSLDEPSRAQVTEVNGARVDERSIWNSFKPYNSVREVQKSKQEVSDVASQPKAARSPASFNDFNPTLPSRNAAAGSQGDRDLTFRPLSANGFKSIVPTRGAPKKEVTSRVGSASNVGGIARPNKFEPLLPNRETQTNWQPQVVASSSVPVINVGGSARPNKFEPFVPTRKPQTMHKGNTVAPRPIESAKPNKFAPFVPTREAQKDREDENAASNQDLVSFLKSPQTSKKKNAKDVASSLSAMSSTPTFYNDFASPQAVDVPARKQGTFGNQNYNLNFSASTGALQETPSAVEVPMDTPARQSLPPHLSLCQIPGKGLGVTTNKPIKIGEFIGNYEGEIMPEEVKDRRYLKSLQHKLTDEDREWIQSRLDRGQTITGCYLYGVDLDGGNIYKHFGRNRGNGDEKEEEHVSRIFVDAEDEYKSLWTRFINHASPPLDNLKPMSVPESYDGKPRVWFMAKRDIEAGEELCFDYGDDYWLEGDEVF